jgi:hypothetical protein
MTRFTPQWLQAGSYAAGVDRRLIGALWPVAASAGGAVTAGAGMVVNVAPGQVAVPTPNNTGSVLCTWDATENVTLAAAPGAGLNRWDLIVCQARGADLDGGANNDFIFTQVNGLAAASPAVPAVPAGAVCLAQILTNGGTSTVGPISDQRPGNLAISTAAAGTLLGSSYTTADTVSGGAGLVQGTGSLITITFAVARKVLLLANGQMNGDIANFQARMAIRVDGAVPANSPTFVTTLPLAGSTGRNTLSPSQAVTVAAGSHTFDIAVARSGATGTNATMLAPATLFVVDAGPAGP